MSPPRVRFAPSPTGYLHVGGARTALFNWLYAKQTGGTFILRIEDTDRARSTAEHTQIILDGLAWLGLPWDEGPVFQGANVDRHRADAERLVAEGSAYRCFCTKAQLDEARASAPPGTFKYDRRCHHLAASEVAARTDRGEPFAVRFLMPDDEMAWDDLVRERISFQGKDLDDLVILRSDGSPTYNLAVVSDDSAMGITLVLRGDDHLSNTPKQVALYRALGVPVPSFAHVPMILQPDGKKLSKRYGAIAVGDYQEQGFLPAAMRNYLALLGWSPGDDREVLTQEELTDAFSLEAIQKKPAVFDLAKLEWMNGQYLTRTPGSALESDVARLLEGEGIDRNGRDLLPIIDAVKSRARTVNQLADRVAIRLDRRRVELDDKARALIEKMGAAYERNLTIVGEALRAVQATEWTPDHLLTVIRGAAESEGIKLGEAMQPVRVALTGTTVSEPVNELLWVVGRDESLARLSKRS